MKERTRTWRLPPCPPYDVEGTESWLCDMALQGWMLEKEGIFWGVASFEKKAPAPVRYRLEAAPKKASDWDQNNGRPDVEAVSINAAYGWEYIARRGQFYIYRNEIPGERELNTDPQVQALTIKTLQKRQISNLSALVFVLIFCRLLDFGLGASWVLAAAEVGLWIILLIIAGYAGIVLGSIPEIAHLQRLKKKLKAGIPLDHNKSWKSSYKRYIGKRLTKYFLVLLWTVLCLQWVWRAWSGDIVGANKQERTDCEGTLPFATMADFAEGTYEETWKDTSYDYVMRWSNAVVTTGIKWAEHASIHRSDGSVLQGGLYVTYYQAKSEWLAKIFAAEYRRVDRVKAGKNYAVLDCPDFGLDSAIAYTNEIHFPCIILRQGNIVIRANFFQTDPGDVLPLYEWAGILADSIRKG